MAVRQYIGARYVPKFVGLWNNTTIYNALEVVDNGSGTSYIARKTVPAGTPLTDTDFWFVYGASSGAILDLQSRMTTAENEINNLKNSGKYLIAIGDSWTVPDDSWATIVAANLGLTLKNYATSGAGFAATGTGGKTFGNQIDDFLDEDIPSEEIAAIIVYGALNDYYFADTTPDDTYKALVNTTLNKLSAYKCKKYLFYGSTGLLNTQRAINYYSAVIPYLYANHTDFICKKALNWLDYWYIGANYYKSDNIHPTNTSGSPWLANVIESVLMTGTAPENKAVINAGNGYNIISHFIDDVYYMSLDLESLYGTSHTTDNATFDTLVSPLPYFDQLIDPNIVIPLLNRTTFGVMYLMLVKSAGVMRLYHNSPNTTFLWGNITEITAGIVKG